jgi:hypothetical protein
MLGVKASSKSGLARRPRLKRSFAQPVESLTQRAQRSRRKKQKLNFPYLCDLDDLCPQSLFISWRRINHRPQTGKPPSHSATPELLQLLTSSL